MAKKEQSFRQRRAAILEIVAEKILGTRMYLLSLVFIMVMLSTTHHEQTQQEMTIKIIQNDNPHLIMKKRCKVALMIFKSCKRELTSLFSSKRVDELKKKK